MVLAGLGSTRKPRRRTYVAHVDFFYQHSSLRIPTVYCKTRAEGAHIGQDQVEKDAQLRKPQAALDLQVQARCVEMPCIDLLCRCCAVHRRQGGTTTLPT